MLAKSLVQTKKEKSFNVQEQKLKLKQLTFTLNSHNILVNRCYVIIQESFIAENLSAQVALMLLEVRPQVFSHGLICSVFLAAYFTFDPVVFPVVKHMQSQRIFCVESSSFKIADKEFWLMDGLHVLLKMSLTGQ